MRPVIELFYDFRSPYSYLALTQLIKMDAPLILRPIRILDVMNQVGNVPTTITCKAKNKYAGVDLGRWAARYGVSLKPSDMRSNDGEACARAVLAATTPDAALKVTLALFQAMWGKAAAVPDADAAITILKGEGLDTDGLFGRINSPETIVQLDRNVEEAVARGVFGAPTMFVGREMFFGNDRLDFLREELNRLEKAA